jgi:transposase
MLRVETIARIRREHAGGKSIRAIARDHRMSRHTVRKYLRSGQTEAVYERTRQPLPQLGPFIEALDGLLDENETRPARDRLNRRQIYEALVAQGYAGSYDAVRRYAARWREGRRRAGDGVTGAFVPLAFAPGEAYQFDWSEEWIVLNGTTTKVQVAHMRLCHSRMPFVRVYLRQTLEMVLDAHVRAFAFFGGACGRGIYDNMKTAVDVVLPGKERRFNRRFEVMCSHYLVEPVACTPAAGWEKGQVENQVGTMRGRFFRPRPRVSSLEELNRWLEESCRSWAQGARHPEQPERTVWEVFEAERSALRAAPVPFDGYREMETTASRTCLVRHERNQYSVAAHAANGPVQVRVYADRIVIMKDGVVIGAHARRFGRGEVSYDPVHYIPILARKPGALRNGAPFRDWRMPAGLAQVQRRLGRSDEADRQFVRILAAIPEHGVEAVDAACREALAQNTCRPDVVLNILHRRRDGSPAPPIAIPTHLTLAVPPRADCARYDALRAANDGG